MSSPQVNGEVPHSVFLEHLLDYPVIHDSVTTFKSNPYGQRSLALGDSAYQTLAKPMLPYLSKPYQLVSPYVKRADEMGEKTLSGLDTRFPIVKKPTGQLYADAKCYVLYPVQLGQSGRDHVLKTYRAEYKKVGGDTLLTYGKAVVTTALVLTSETLSNVSAYLSAKKDETKTAVSDKSNH